MGVTQLKSPMSTLSNFSYLHFTVSAKNVTSKQTSAQIILFKVKVAEPTQALLLGLPNTVNNILDVQDEVSLTVSGIAEGHVRRVGLRNRCEGQVGRPGLDENHVASHEASGVCAAARIGLAVEDDRAIAVGGVSEDLVEKNCKSIEVTNVQGTKVRVECIIQESIINSEVDGRSALACWGSGLSPSSPLSGRLGFLDRIREWGARGRSRVVRGQVQAICVLAYC